MIKTKQDAIRKYSNLLHLYERSKAIYEYNGNGRSVHEYHNKRGVVATTFVMFREAIELGHLDINACAERVEKELNNFVEWVGRQAS